LKIAIISTSGGGGGYVRMKAYRDFLVSKGHHVTVIQFPGQGYLSKLDFYCQSIRARFQGHEVRLMRKIADKLEKRIKADRYDAVICIETKLSYVLTKELRCLKIFSCESLEADELYFSRRTDDFERIRAFRQLELEILRKSDYVVFPWETTKNYAQKYVWNGNNYVTIKYGCYPQNKTASYFFPVSIVSLGSLWGNWSNKELLSYLTSISPYAIDVYGKFKPEKNYHLNYKGFAPSLDILMSYQFGLNTVSKDLFRRNHHASRVMSYLAYGLPVMSPDWMKFSHELKGVLPYNEDNFLDILEEYTLRDPWEKLSEEAKKQARELDWRITLEPLEKIIEK